MVYDRGGTVAISQERPWARDAFLSGSTNMNFTSNLHTIYVEGEPFRIPKAYRVKKVIGQGSYGLVW
jgi:hypothetical protein